MAHTVEVVVPNASRGAAAPAGRGPALAAIMLALGAVCALAVRAGGDGATQGALAALALRNAAETQMLVTIPGSGSVGVALSKHSAVDYCTLPGQLVGVSPPDFYCTDVTGNTDAYAEALVAANVTSGVVGGSVDTCNDCSGTCLSPASALENRDISGQDEDTCGDDGASSCFEGWNPQGGPENDANQYIDFDLGGRGATVKALLWANAGDTDHDPANIKVWSSDDGVTYELVAEVDVSALQGDETMQVVAVPNEDTRAKYWRINPGGIAKQSIPRVMGLCNTADCQSCLYEDRNVPEQGYNALGAVKPDECWDGEPNGYIYCLGNYDSDPDLNKNLERSHVSISTFFV